MTVESYRIVENDPEFGQYRDLTENKHQPLPDGVMRWYSSQHHSYATPDGYLVPVRPETENDCAKGCATHATCRLQAIAEAASESFMWCFTHRQRRLQCEWADMLYECSDVDVAVVVRASLLDALTEESSE